MRLSVTYNFFDGGEFLVRSIEAIRPHVDHLSIVYQRVSNFGHAMTEASTSALEEIRDRGLAEDLIPYHPNLALGGGRNEFTKRGIGLARARAVGASHVLLLDADEFYVPEQFVSAKQAVESQGFDYTTVGFSNYYRYPTWRAKGVAGMVPFICRLTDNTSHEFAVHYPHAVDPTRMLRVSDGHHHLFDPRQIEMHHMTGVRHNLEEKLSNSSQNDDPQAMAAVRATMSLVPGLRLGRVRHPEGFEVEIEEVPDAFGLSQFFPRE